MSYPLLVLHFCLTLFCLAFESHPYSSILRLSLTLFRSEVSLLDFQCNFNRMARCQSHNGLISCYLENVRTAVAASGPNLRHSGGDVLDDDVHHEQQLDEGLLF